MNKHFEIKGNEVTVYNEYRKKSKREFSDNIEEILIAENNIEEIEKIIDNNELDLKLEKRKKKVHKLYYINSGIWIVSFILNLLSANFFACSMNLLCSLMWGANAYFSARPHTKKIKKYELENKYLEKKLQEEQEHLEKLKNNKENNIEINNNIIEKEISTSEKIKELKDILWYINCYVKEKKDFIKWYKEGCINKKFADKRVCNFIIELIKMELNETDINTNIHTKVLKKEKGKNYE